MRTLCLNLQGPENPSVAESFLGFSPRVQYREPGFIFADVTSTSALFGGEHKLAEEALSFCRQFYPESTLSIADHPWTAQVLSEQKEFSVVSPTEDVKNLLDLPIDALKNLEGLIAWDAPDEVEEIIQFFQILGIKSIGEIRDFQVEAFQERWGKTGVTLWKRLHGLDRQVISPLLPEEALTEYTYLDFPVSLLPFLTHCIEKRLKKLFSRLQGRGEFLRKLQIQLFCEYSSECHLIEVVPAQPSRDLELFLKLIENKLADVSLDNPIRQLEIEAIPCMERVQQLDFWGPQQEDYDKLSSLISQFNQAHVATGFFHSPQTIWPEENWETTTEFLLSTPLKSQINHCGSSFQIKPSYSQHLSEAPRPSRILETPQRLSDAAVMELHFLSSHPLERLEDSWWYESRGRDYYIAANVYGQMLWVFYDHIEREYFIHGYFD